LAKEGLGEVWSTTTQICWEVDQTTPPEPTERDICLMARPPLLG
jgi:hypothetical protein